MNEYVFYAQMIKYFLKQHTKCEHFGQIISPVFVIWTSSITRSGSSMSQTGQAMASSGQNEEQEGQTPVQP